MAITPTERNELKRAVAEFQSAQNELPHSVIDQFNINDYTYGNRCVFNLRMATRHMKVVLQKSKQCYFFALRSRLPINKKVLVINEITNIVRSWTPHKYRTYAYEEMMRSIISGLNALKKDLLEINRLYAKNKKHF
jgi:hypothetical protein